jgi:two-component system response regulator HydG
VIDHIRVLIANDDIAAAHRLGQSLIQQGYFCEVAPTARAALAVMQRGACDLVICDVRIDAGEAFELLEGLKRTAAKVPVIILTANGSTQEAVEAIKHGAFQYLVRPCPIDDLHGHINRALAQVAALGRRWPSGAHTPWSSEIVHECSAMKTLLESVARVALSSAPVLILGDSGTGKERIARAIHAAGPRQARAFVAVNTSAIPEALLESELFGHVRGAYTGATQARSGLFQEADGGTLFLDEIGDMPRVLQPKLLRALQFGEIRAVGSDHARPVDVRIVAATHRDLDTLVREGGFRDDLRYRLNTVVLMIPPLRARREDIGVLVQQFLVAARARSPASPVTGFSREALALLEQASWPGNVRELESAVERAVILGRDATVAPADLAFLQEASAPSTSSAWPQANGRHFTLRQMNQR